MSVDAWTVADPPECLTCGRDACEDHLPPQLRTTLQLSDVEVNAPPLLDPADTLPSARTFLARYHTIDKVIALQQQASVPEVASYGCGADDTDARLRRSGRCRGGA